MDVGTLKNLRSVWPGVLILTGGLPLFAYVTNSTIDFSEGLQWSTLGLGLAVATVIGYAYNLYCFRAVFNRRSHTRITDNIKRRLLDMGRTAPLTPERRTALLSSGQLMLVFYSLVDTNNTLQERAKLVRSNGIVWSSIADAVVLGAVFCVLYLPIWYVTKDEQFLTWSIASGGIALLAALILHPAAEKRHIALGNDQLNFIESQLKPELIKKVDAL